MDLKETWKRLVKSDKQVKISKRQFLVTILFVILMGSIGLAVYTYSLLGDEYARNRSTTIMGQPKYLHPVGGTDDQRLSKPLSVAVSGKYVYIADSGDGKLAVFTKRGALVKSVKLIKDGEPYPIGITLDDQGKIYISVEIRGFYHIMVVDSSGKFQYLFPGTSAISPKQPILNHPMGLYYQNDKIYVTDAGDHDVKVFSTDGKLLKRFGRPGTKAGEFLYPHGIVADKDDNIYVADSNNSRVQVFDKNGKFKYFFKPNSKEPLVVPRGIAIDSLGRVHVVDLARQKVFVFTKQGNYLLSYGTGLRGTSLFYPNGIAIDKNAGLIYIADRQNNRIAVFSE